MTRCGIRNSVHCLLLGLVFGFVPLTLQGATFHVATTGLDSNPGTGAAPWRTLQYAVDNVAPGDEVVVHAGNYSGARIESSGTVSAYITLRTATGEAVILDTPAAGHKHDSILEVETWDSPGIVAYWVIDGFEIVGAGRSGVDLRLTHHIVVRDNQVHGSGLTGIFTGKFAEDPASSALAGRDIRIGRILHPSPASPITNRGWAKQAGTQFEQMGLILK
jgi:hypothetical protein